MTDNESQQEPVTQRVSGILARLKRHAEEHEARMAADPLYRAEQEALAAKAAEQERRMAEYEAGARTRALQARRETQGIPERVIRLLASAAETEATLAVADFMRGQSVVLVLLGGEGCGKTVAACQGLDSQSKGMFVKAGAVARAGAFDRELFEALDRAQVLVVDDLGVEPLDEKGWAMSVIAQLLDARYDSCRKTILTSNLTPEQFTARYLSADGGRLRGRFREAGVIVTLGGKSMRGAA